MLACASSSGSIPLQSQRQMVTSFQLRVDFFTGFLSRKHWFSLCGMCWHLVAALTIGQRQVRSHKTSQDPNNYNYADCFCELRIPLALTAITLSLTSAVDKQLWAATSLLVCYMLEEKKDQKLITTTSALFRLQGSEVACDLCVCARFFRLRCGRGHKAVRTRRVRALVSLSRWLQLCWS